MPVVNVRELSRRTAAVVSAVTRTRRPTLVTRAGKPVAAVIPIDPGAIEDWVLANAPEFVASMDAAERDLRTRRVISLDEVLSTKTVRRGRAAKRR